MKFCFKNTFGFIDIMYINKQKIKLHFKQTHDKNFKKPK